MHVTFHLYMYHFVVHALVQIRISQQTVQVCVYKVQIIITVLANFSERISNAVTI